MIELLPTTAKDLDFIFSTNQKTFFFFFTLSPFSEMLYEFPYLSVFAVQIHVNRWS